MPEIWLEPDELQALQDIFDWRNRFGRPLDWAAYDRARARIVNNGTGSIAATVADSVGALDGTNGTRNSQESWKTHHHVPAPALFQQLAQHEGTAMTTAVRRRSVKARVGSTTSEVPVTIDAADLLYERIARRAYELYLTRGREPGHDVEDWVQAEAEVKNSLMLS